MDARFQQSGPDSRREITFGPRKADAPEQFTADGGLMETWNRRCGCVGTVPHPGCRWARAL